MMEKKKITIIFIIPPHTPSTPWPPPMGCHLSSESYQPIAVGPYASFAYDDHKIQVSYSGDCEKNLQYPVLYKDEGVKFFQSTIGSTIFII